ncbi:hypothetical protein [Helicobacter sp. 11S02596-1]|uniref:hypothetical protein n=1 Tax=Helicobacter sp. 11S02596-1 TaxID=1476194 RepID=UPI000BA517F0|nr:hypothetical protein [Helicobacter sp. 11S02596-1]PAF44047.1 hypothetical protein BJI48_04505 [Helicobacter sp. 11S02596-1]
MGMFDSFWGGWWMNELTRPNDDYKWMNIENAGMPDPIASMSLDDYVAMKKEAEYAYEEGYKRGVKLADEEG